MNKNRKVFILAGLFAVLAALTVQAESGLIAYVEGEVTVRRGSERIDGEIGTGLTSGDVVSTSSGSVAILSLTERGKIKLRGSTVLSLDDIGNDTTVTLERGGIFSKIWKLAGRARYEVRTHSTVAGVRGTEFFVAYGRKIEKDFDVWLCVNEGAVEVSLPASDSAAVVEQGEGVNILGGNRITEPKFYPWTTELNWNMDPDEGDVRDDTDLDEAYTDLLDQDYE